jgi:hypothetical protein
LGADLARGVLGCRPSVPSVQRRTIGAGASERDERLRPRRWHADGLLRDRESRAGSRLAEVARLNIVRGVTRYR